MQTSIRSSRMGRIMGGEHCGFQTMKDGRVYYNVYNCTFACEGPKAEWWVASSGANRTEISAFEPRQWEILIIRGQLCGEYGGRHEGAKLPRKFKKRKYNNDLQSSEMFFLLSVKYVKP